MDAVSTANKVQKSLEENLFRSTEGIIKKRIKKVDEKDINGLHETWDRAVSSECDIITVQSSILQIKHI